MNIEARKIEFIQEFLKLQSEEALLKLEKLLKKSSDSEKNESMSVLELNRRIDKSVEDSNNGKLTEATDLLTEIEEWS